MPNNIIKPACDFCGYHLKRCDYSREISSRGIKKIIVEIKNMQKYQNNNVRFEIHVAMTFLDNVQSRFIYSSLFHINDEIWYKNNENNGEALRQLFCIVFPYVRESITSITNDSIGTIILPAMNVVGLDVNKPIIFESTAAGK